MLQFSGDVLLLWTTKNQIDRAWCVFPASGDDFFLAAVTEDV